METKLLEKTWHSKLELAERTYVGSKMETEKLVKNACKYCNDTDGRAVGATTGRKTLERGRGQLMRTFKENWGQPQ